MKQRNGWFQSKRNGWKQVTGLMTSVMLFAVVSLTVFAQNESSDAYSGKTGVVTGDQVRLRGGPGTNYKKVGLVDQGKKLQVVRKQGKWLEVAPPSEARVWIYGEYVEEIDSSTGKVTGTDVNVRPLPRADQTNSPVGQVSEPARVIIHDSRKGDTDEHPWYEIQMPEGLNPWIHSKFVQVDSTDAGGTGDETAEQPQSNEETSDQPQKGESSGDGGAPQKGEGVQKGGGQKGGVQKGGGGSSDQTIGSPGAPDKWVDRLKEIQQDVRDEREKEDKLRWDFTDQIQKLNSYIQNVPDERLKSQAQDLRNDLKEVQSNVKKQRERLNERLREIKKERQEQVRNSLQDVLEAKGFTWDAVGYVKTPGGLYTQPPGDFELVKGEERIYFLTSGRDILDLRNYLHLQVAISGNEKPVDDNRWDVPLLEVKKIEVIK